VRLLLVDKVDVAFVVGAVGEWKLHNATRVAAIKNSRQLGALRHWRDQVLVQNFGVYLAIMLKVNRADRVVYALSA
jgi:hypothetical protein